jgi:uncharacterized membrane protein
VFDTVGGVPVHPLVVHAVVVLVPLAALGGIAIALVPALRRRYGPLLGAAAAAAVASVVLAQETGEKLFARQSARFGPDQAEEAGLMERHRELAEQLLPWTVVLLAGIALVVLPPLVARRPQRVLVPAGPGPADEPGAPAWQRPVAVLGAVVTLVGAVLTLVLVVRIGHLGSEAAWDRSTSAPAASVQLRG